MSADNGIYVGRFLKNEGGFEYRVIHAQAIENCEYEELAQAYQVLYYGNSEVYDNEHYAWIEAEKLYDEIMESDCRICEYGIHMLTYDKPFPTMTREEAEKICYIPSR